MKQKTVLARHHTKTLSRFTSSHSTTHRLSELAVSWSTQCTQPTVLTERVQLFHQQCCQSVINVNIKKLGYWSIYAWSAWYTL